MTDAFRIESLKNAHDRTAFSSGAQQIDDWFHMQAGQASRRGIATIHVMVDNATGAVIGFSTLSNFTIRAGNLPPAVGRTLPDRILLPAHLIGQLAVDARQQGKGYGGLLLFDAVHRAPDDGTFGVARSRRSRARYTDSGMVHPEWLCTVSRTPAQSLHPDARHYAILSLPRNRQHPWMSVRAALAA